MRWVRYRSLVIAASLITALQIALSSETRACGFHTRESIALAFLAIAYPEVTHVTGAIWRAQQAGRLEMPNGKHIMAVGQQRKIVDTAAYYDAVRALLALEKRFSDCNCGIGAFSLVLVEKVLWTRFNPGGETKLHADSPGPGGLVIATGLPVLKAVTSGKLTVSDALGLGVIRLYGSKTDQTAFGTAFAAVGDAPLEPVSYLEVHKRLAAQPVKLAGAPKNPFAGRHRSRGPRMGQR